MNLREVASWATAIALLSDCTPLQACQHDADCPPLRWCDTSARLCVAYQRPDGGTGGDAGASTDGGGGGGGGGTDGGSTDGDAGSDGGPLRDGPFLDADRTRLAFGLEFGHGVWVGTTVTETLQLRNLGAQPLIISSVTVEGPERDLFTASLAPAPDGGTTSIPTSQRAFVQVAYAPKAPASHQATLRIASSATNQPSFTVPLAGRAVAP